MDNKDNTFFFTYNVQIKTILKEPGDWSDKYCRHGEPSESKIEVVRMTWTTVTLNFVQSNRKQSMT